MEERKPLDYLCYCGLYCKLCSAIAITPKLADSLKKSMQEDGWEHYGSYVYEEFKAFWEVLQKMSQVDKTSTLCRGDCGDPDCKIRICARSKQIDVCAFCDEFPCPVLEKFAGGYQVVLTNNYRIREVGLDKWLQEQEALVAKGLTHRDLA